MAARYVYVASSWRNPLQPEVCKALADAGIDHYDFRNPPGGTGFSWREVKSADGPGSVEHWCVGCAKPIALSPFGALGRWEPDYDPDRDPVVWRHLDTGYAGCDFSGRRFAEPGPKPKGSDWERVEEYLQMVNHPRAREGFEADFGAMRRADAIVMVLPCGKSAHLELGWAVGAGKATCILLEDPVEPELMYRMVDRMVTSVDQLMRWVGRPTPPPGA